MTLLGSSTKATIFFFLTILPRNDASSAFIFQNNEANAKNAVMASVSKIPKALQELQQNHSGNKLNIELILENPQDRIAQLALNGLQVELTHDAFLHDETTINALPTKDDTKTTSGMKALHVRNPASFVGGNGQEQVTMIDGCWELSFTPGMLAGNLICGLNVPKEARRNQNGAILPAGPLYLSFLVWTTEEYHRHCQALQTMTDQTEQDYFVLQQALSDLEDDATSLLDKLLLLKKVQDYQATHDEGWNDLQRMWSITPNDADVLPTESGLVLWTRGATWTRKEQTTKSNDSSEATWVERLLEQVGDPHYQFLGNANLVSIQK